MSSEGNRNKLEVRQGKMNGKRALWIGVSVGLFVAVSFGLSMIYQARIPASVHMGVNDGGQTVQLKVGQGFDLDLVAGEGMPLSSDSTVVKAQGEEVCSRTGDCTRYHFVALKPGEADLTYEKRPVCASGEMCPQFIMLFTVHVQVKA